MWHFRTNDVFFYWCCHSTQLLKRSCLSDPIFPQWYIKEWQFMHAVSELEWITCSNALNSVVVFFNLLPTSMSLKVSEILGRFIQLCVQYCISLWIILREQDLKNSNINELMDDESRTMHSHYSCNRSFTFPRSAINAAFFLTFKFCIFNRFQSF